MVDEVGALREATCEAHQALKDLRAEHKELKDTHEGIRGTQRALLDTYKAIRETIAQWEKTQANAKLMVQDELLKAVRAELPKVVPTVKAAVAKAEKEITDRFQQLAATMLGELESEEPSLPEVIKVVTYAKSLPKDSVTKILRLAADLDVSVPPKNSL